MSRTISTQLSRTCCSQSKLNISKDKGRSTFGLTANAESRAGEPPFPESLEGAVDDSYHENR